MHDELFGHIEYDLRWLGECSWPIFGDRVITTLSIPCDEGDEIQTVQREAFAAFNAQKDVLCARAEDAILAYYRKICPEYRARFGSAFADQWAPEACTISDVGRLATPTELIIQQSFTDPAKRIIGLLFDCSWDPSSGLAVKFVDERISEVGTQDIVI
jgi:hypothetical protein